MTTLWQKGKLTLNSLNKDLFILLLLLVSIHLFYIKTIQAGFVTDFTGLQQRLEGAHFADFLNCFGFPAMHQVTNFFLYLFYKFFGTNGLPWYLIFTSLHVANGFLVYKLGEKVFSHLDRINSPKIPALFSSLLFLFNPYNAEPVIWKVCFNFLFCSFLMLASLWQLTRWVETSDKRRLVWANLFFVGSLFTFELAIVLPIIGLVWAWLILSSFKNNEGQSKAATLLKHYTLPQFFLIAIYFLLNKLILGNWVGHYGADVHLKFDLAKMGSNFLKYLTKYLLYWRDWSHSYKEKLIMFCDQPAVGWGLVIICSLLVIHVLARLMNKPKQNRSRTLNNKLNLILFFVALLPVNNLYVAWILHGENDRYGYFASLFFFMGLSGLLMYLPKAFRYGLFVVLLSFSILFLHRITGYWQNGCKVYYSLLHDFRWQESKEVFILAFPENYQGIPIFKDFSRQDLALKHALKFSAGKETEAQFFQIAQFNMTSPEDGVSVQIDSTDHYTVTFNQWGNWWWRNGIGTGDYETDKYRFNTAGNGSKVELKKPLPGAVVIYTDGGKWKKAGF